MSERRTVRPAVLGVVVGVSVLGMTAGGLTVAAPAAAVSPDVVISEVYGGGGNTGASFTHDFIELRNDGTAPVDLSGWSVQYASAAGTSWQSTALSGVLAPGGNYLVQQGAGAGNGSPLPTPNASGTISMAAGTGKVALATSTAALSCGTGCSGTTGVRDLVGYGTTTRGGEGAPTATLSNSTSAARTSGDTDDNAADFTVGPPSPTGSVLVVPDPEPEPDPLTCDTPAVSIGSVQGSTDVSPVEGSTVVVRGTVVGDLQAGSSVAHVQDVGDGDAATSDAIVVFGTDTAVAVGDSVVVRGTVDEFNGLTELTDVTTVACGTAALPPATALPLPSTTAQREALEGMLVAPPADLTVTEVFGLDRFGELLLAAGGRLVTPTEAAAPGDAAAAVAAANAARSITLDDAVTAQVAAPPYLTVDDPVRVGDTAVLEPTVLGYGFGEYRLQPADGTAAGMAFPATNPRPRSVPEVGGDLRIADFNVLNYFVTFGGRSRGATSPAELAQQEAKIVTAITELDADVITLHEIENSAVTTPDTPYAAVERLVAQMNAAAGTDAWRYVRAHEDTDVITNAVVYRDDAVTPVGDPRVPADLSAFGNARSPIAQTFTARGEVFTVVANHLKSKGSSCGAGSDDTRVGGNGNCNGDRVAQARALVAFAAQLQAETGDTDVLLTGDFNAYRYEDPITTITDAGYTDLGPVLAEGQYSYVFDGGSGSLDHALASSSMVPKVTGLGVWDVNAVESAAYQYDGTEALYAPYAYRASDHNPTVLGLDLPAAATLDDATPSRGDRVTITGVGFVPGETVRATLPDEPSRARRQLGTGVADAEGTVTIAFTVPRGYREGTHRVLLTGAGGDTASTRFTLRPVSEDTGD